MQTKTSPARNLLDTLYLLFKGAAKLLSKKIHKSNAKTIYIYGAGEIGVQLVAELQRKSQVQILGIIDRKAEQAESTLDAIPISPPANLQSVQDGMTVAIASEEFLDEIKARIVQETAGKQINIIHV